MAYKTSSTDWQPPDTEKFSLRQSNPTYELTTGNGHDVLRTQPIGILLKSAHAVDCEFRVMAALKKTQVPVPTIIAKRCDPSIIGMKFFVMPKIEGKTVFNPALDGYGITTRRQLYYNQADVLAKLATISLAAIDLENFGKPSGYLDRQICTWTHQYRATQTADINDVEFLIDHLDVT